MATALIAVEGVLGEHSHIHGFYPIPDGLRLARAIHSTFQVVFSTLNSDPTATEFWLRMNGMAQPSFYDQLVHREPTDLGEDIIAHHAQSLRAGGADVGLVISGDPEGILAVTELGFPSLLFVNPAYRWAEYRPDRKRLPRPWQDIDDEVTRQRDLRASDPRLHEEESA